MIWRTKRRSTTWLITVRSWQLHLRFSVPHRVFQSELWRICVSVMTAMLQSSSYQRLSQGRSLLEMQVDFTISKRVNVLVEITGELCGTCNQKSNCIISSSIIHACHLPCISVRITHHLNSRKRCEIFINNFQLGAYTLNQLILHWFGSWSALFCWKNCSHSRFLRNYNQGISLCFWMPKICNFSWLF